MQEIHSARFDLSTGPRLAGADDGLLVFLHLPKTAGSTLNSILDQQYDADAIYTIDSAITEQSQSRLREMSDAQKRRLRVVRGHMPFGIHRWMSNKVTYVTMLRDPVQRTVSNYYYARHTPAHHLYDSITSGRMSLCEFVSSGISTDLDNGQTRLLSGASTIASRPFVDTGVAFGACTREMLETAKRNLRESFDFVGVTERFDEGLVMLQRRLGWRRPFYERQNTNRNRPSTLSREEEECVRAHNELDLELYDFVCMAFDREVRAEQPPLQGAVRRLRIYNSAMKSVRTIRRGVIGPITRVASKFALPFRAEPTRRTPLSG